MLMFGAASGILLGVAMVFGSMGHGVLTYGG